MEKPVPMANIKEEEEEEQREENNNVSRLILGAPRSDGLFLVDRDSPTIGDLVIIQKQAITDRWPEDFVKTFLCCRYTLRENKPENDDTFRQITANNMMVPGLYGVKRPLTYLELLSLGLEITDHNQRQNIVLATQFLVLASSGQEMNRYALLPPRVERTGITTFDRQANTYLDDDLSENTHFLWFKGIAPFSSAFVANAAMKPARPVLKPGFYTLWAMQFDPKLDVDEQGAPLVRWRLIQTMRVRGQSKRKGPYDLVVNEEHILMPNTTLVLPKNQLTNQPFAKWQWRPLDGYIWRPLPKAMDEQRGEPKNEYDLQGIYRAQTPIIREPLLNTIQAALIQGELSVPANLVSDLDQEEEVDRAGVTLLENGLNSIQASISDKLAQLQKITSTMSWDQLLSGSNHDVSEAALKLLQLRWLTSYYQSILRISGPEILSVETISPIFIVMEALQQAVDNVNIPTSTTSLGNTDRAVFLEKVALYAPFYLPALLRLDLEQEPFGGAYEPIFISLAHRMASQVVKAHPKGFNVALGKNLVQQNLASSNIETLQNNPKVQKELNLRTFLFAAMSMDVMGQTEDLRNKGSSDPEILKNIMALANVDDSSDDDEFKDDYSDYEGSSSYYATDDDDVDDDDDDDLPRGSIPQGTGPPVLLPGIGEPKQLRPISAPVLLLNAQPRELMTSWQQLYAMLFLHWRTIDRRQRFPEPAAVVSRYIHQVRAAVSGIDKNTGRLYDVANPKWGESTWMAASDNDDQVEDPSLTFLRQALSNGPTRLETPLIDLLQEAITKAQDPTIIRHMIMTFQSMSRALQDRIVADGRVVKRAVRGLIDENARLDRLSLIQIEHVAAAYDMMDRIPKAMPTVKHKRLTLMHPVEQRFGESAGRWVGMPSSWTSGPQIHSALDQVLERLEALRLVQERYDRDPSVTKEDILRTAEQLKKEPLRWSSLYIPMDRDLLQQQQQATVPIKQPNPFIDPMNKDNVIIPSIEAIHTITV